MRSGCALRWALMIGLALAVACTEQHTFSDGHVIEIAGNENYWFRWIMLGVCALGVLVLIGLALSGQGLRIGIYALPFAIGAVLVYPGTTTPRARSLARIEAYQAKLAAQGGGDLLKEAPAVAASLRARLDNDVAAFEKALAPKLEAARAELRPALETLAKGGVLTFADLQQRAESGDAAANKALASIERAARLARAAAAAKALREKLERSIAELGAVAESNHPPPSLPVADQQRRLAAARDLASAPLPSLDADPGDHRRKLFESIVGPPPAEKPL